MHHSDDLEARKLISDAIAALCPANVAILLQKPQFVCKLKAVGI
jgi:hypothetical protein